MKPNLERARAMYNDELVSFASQTLTPKTPKNVIDAIAVLDGTVRFATFFRTLEARNVLIQHVASKLKNGRTPDSIA